jgi:hypothetical protein
MKSWGLTNDAGADFPVGSPELERAPVMSDNQPPAPASPRAGHHVLHLVSLALVVVLLFSGGIWVLTRFIPSSHSVPQTSLTPTSIPTATATTAVQRVVYAASWSHGVSGWTLPSSVQVMGGKLVFNGSGTANLEVPYHTPIIGYTVEMSMEIDSVNSEYSEGTITIAGQDASGKDQYYAELSCAGKEVVGCHGGQSSVGTEGGVYPSGLGVSDFAIGPSLITYTFQVGTSDVELCAGLACLSAGYVRVPTSALTLVLQDTFLRVVITSMTISIP